MLPNPPVVSLYEQFGIKFEINKDPRNIINAHNLITVNYIFKNRNPISFGKYKLPSCLSKMGSISFGLARISKSMLKKAPPKPNPDIIIPLTSPFLFGK